jgi:NAD(P)-dependent dehydrogenase (short-subunit alcohol dehydrogenase family)
VELLNKFALVTGGGSGIGAATAVKLAEAGADVAIVSRSRNELDEVARKIRSLGRRALVLPASVQNDVEMGHVFKEVRSEFGGLDILFANAGVNGMWAPIEDLTAEEWDETIAINLRGTFLALHHAVPLMKSKGGSVIITSSINGTRTFTTAGASAYATSKAGQLAFGQMAALELARYGIRVNIVCPGAIDTEIDDNSEKRNTEAAKVPANFPKGTVPLTRGKSGTSDEVADLVMFLASDRARHVTGTPVWIDGAQSLLV